MKYYDVIRAFEAKQAAKSGNYESDGRSLFLFGNKIATHEERGVMFSMQGWNTPTTKKALNALSNVSIHTQNGIIRNNGIEINVNDWYYVNDFKPTITV
jgi:hypothetical protein